MSAKKVLVVDDEASIREMLRLALEISDFECLEAADIHEAYRLITDESPDMVLLDWMLPGGSGIELLRRLKKEEATQALPVIMLTAKTHEDNVVQGLEVGADDYITKPFAPKELIARMKAILRRSSSEEGGSELRVGQRVGHADKELTGFQLVQIFLAIGRIAARSLNLQDCLSVGKDVVPVGEFRAGVFIIAVGKPGRLASAAFDADLDTVFLEQCTDVGGRQCDALFAGANFLGYTDNHLRYPHFMVRKNRSI